MSTPKKTVCLALSALVLLGAVCMPFDDILTYLDDVEETDPIDTFDGEWIGVEFSYAMEITDRVGTVTRSNSYAYGEGDPILVILEVDGSRFSGKHLFTDGRARDVIGSLIEPDLLRLTGNGFDWRMTRFKVNLPPNTTSQSVTTPAGMPIEILLTGEDPDTGPEPLKFLITELPTYGRLSGRAPTLTYTPQTGFAGIDVFTYDVTDGEDSVSGSVAVEVIAQE